MRKLIIAFLLSLCVGVALAQSAPVFFKVANEGDVVTTPAFTTFRFGTGTTWTANFIAILNTFTANVNNIANGFKLADPAPNVAKELDVLETSVSQTVFVNGTTVIVPALGGIPIIFNGTKYMCTTISVDSTGTLTLTSCK